MQFENSAVQEFILGFHMTFK